ncbi:glycosyltransferase family 2 protein [Aureimonas fodinaquatilis]|uniref:Glycosyltransferase family 2 protein n=1 Tax=Aureimonas fodinaquatilis TaxID=2565783 RepID=A0A5B0DX04_9HYPH|nr:glycosyltransferase family 2 protein [Aureimonas fodinaquatilis]KAA0970395.1 glycosyltransferase family 2 protein [Aureimonas fodinaquatilis]
MLNAKQNDRPSDRRSLVIPVYGNEENISDLIAALSELHHRVGGMEVIFVVDGSPDRSGELLIEARDRMPFASKIAFHSRNFGSFTAIRTGMELASGDVVAVMAADLQEPPALIENFFHLLESDKADIVFGQRAGRSDAFLRDALSNTFWWLYRKLVIKDVPKGGVDIFACNRAAVDAVLSISEPNSSLIAQLFWIGFRRKFIPYERQKRLKGTSAWNFMRRVRYMMDSIFSFSDLPIILVLWLGIFGCAASATLGLAIAVLRVAGFISEPGFATLSVLITFTASAMLVSQGIVGTYLWRTFENTKRRPLRIVSRVVEFDAFAKREKSIFHQI